MHVNNLAGVRPHAKAQQTGLTHWKLDGRPPFEEIVDQTQTIRQPCWQEAFPGRGTRIENVCEVPRDPANRALDDALRNSRGLAQVAEILRLRQIQGRPVILLGLPSQSL